MKQFGRSAQQSGDVRRQAIAVLSDGEDTSSLISFDDVLAMARKSGINIYTIALQSEYPAARRVAENGRRYFSESDYAMKTLARETGAQSYFPEFVQDLKRVYADIADELANQYSIGYSPSNPRPDGRFRRIVVRVTNHPEFQPRARAGYTAEGIATASTAGRPAVAGGAGLRARIARISRATCACGGAGGWRGCLDRGRAAGAVRALLALSRPDRGRGILYDAAG